LTSPLDPIPSLPEIAPHRIPTTPATAPAEKEEKDKNYRLFERSYGSFSRRLELPAGIDPDAIKAVIANGVLTVTVPKPAPAQVKKVEVKAAA
jgi:HSP20 family protein